MKSSTASRTIWVACTCCTDPQIHQSYYSQRKASAPHVTFFLPVCLDFGLIVVPLSHVSPRQMDEKKSAEERMLAARAESDKLNAQLEAQAQTILRRSASADSEQQAIRAEVERLRRREKELKDQLEEAEKRAAQAVTTQDESKLVEANQAWQARLQKALAEVAEEVRCFWAVECRPSLSRCGVRAGVRAALHKGA